MRVGIYARLSRADKAAEETSGDAANGVTPATGRQIESSRSYAEARGWDVAEVYEDVNLSAFKDVVRPAYERLLADVEAGDIDVVLVWKLDRLARSPREFERFWAVCEKARARLAAVMDPVDTSSEVGMMIVRLMIGFARMESANISTRTKAAHEQRAASGKPHRGGRRPFGLTADWQHIDQPEADLVGEAVQRLLGGQTVTGLTREWQRRDVKTVTGQHFTPSTLRSMLVSPRIAGARQHHGEVASKDGKFPALVPAAEHARLVALLTDPSRRTNGGRGEVYLLTGLLRCGRCGTRLYSHSVGQGRRKYRCDSGPMRGGCGKLAIQAETLEEYVREMVLARVDSPELAAALRERAEATSGEDEQASLRADEQALEQLARDYYVDKLVTRQAFFAANNALQGRVEAGRRRLARRTGSGLLDSLAGTGAARNAWDERDAAWRKALLRSVLDHLAITPGVKGRKTFDPARVQPVWRY